MGSEPEAGQFFVLLSDRDSDYATEMLEDDPVNLGEAPECQECDQFVGGKPWLAPHRAELTLHGRRWGDFAFRVGDETDFLVSEAAARQWRKAGLRGLSGFEPVEITSARLAQLAAPRYLHVEVAHGGAALDEEQSSIIRSEGADCKRCRLGGIVSAIHGFRVAPESWTGEDAFIARGLPGTVVVTSAFKDWVDGCQFSNVRFVPTEIYEWDSMAPLSRSA